MAKKMSEQIEFDEDGTAIISDDGLNFGQDAGGSIKEIVLRHIRKISDISIQEFTPAYWTKKPMQMGDGIAMLEIYHEDKRLAYCNAVDFLLDMIMAQMDTKFLLFYNSYVTLKKDQYTHCNTNNVPKDDWIWMKLEMSRKLFGQILLCFDRISFFDEEVYTE